MICMDCLAESEDLFICDSENCDLCVCSDCIYIKNGGKYCYSCAIEQPPLIFIGA